MSLEQVLHYDIFTSFPLTSNSFFLIIYNNCYSRYPFILETQGCFLNTLLQYVYGKQEKSLNFQQFRNFCCPGTAASGPVMHWFHLFTFHYVYRSQTVEWKQKSRGGKTIIFFQENFSFRVWENSFKKADITPAKQKIISTLYFSSKNIISNLTKTSLEKSCFVEAWHINWFLGIIHWLSNGSRSLVTIFWNIQDFFLIKSIVKCNTGREIPDRYNVLTH